MRSGKQRADPKGLKRVSSALDLISLAHTSLTVSYCIKLHTYFMHNGLPPPIAGYMKCTAVCWYDRSCYSGYSV